MKSGYEGLTVSEEKIEGSEIRLWTGFAYVLCVQDSRQGRKMGGFDCISVYGGSLLQRITVIFFLPLF